MTDQDDRTTVRVDATSDDDAMGPPIALASVAVRIEAPDPDELEKRSAGFTDGWGRLVKRLPGVTDLGASPQAITALALSMAGVETSYMAAALAVATAARGSTDDEEVGQARYDEVVGHAQAQVRRAYDAAEQVLGQVNTVRGMDKDALAAAAMASWVDDDPADAKK